MITSVDKDVKKMASSNIVEEIENSAAIMNNNLTVLPKVKGKVTMSQQFSFYVSIQKN